jgi:hypothetical protein
VERLRDLCERLHFHPCLSILPQRTSLISFPSRIHSLTSATSYLGETFGESGPSSHTCPVGLCRLACVRHRHTRTHMQLPLLHSISCASIPLLTLARPRVCPDVADRRICLAVSLQPCLCFARSQDRYKSKRLRKQCMQRAKTDVTASLLPRY